MKTQISKLKKYATDNTPFSPTTDDIYETYYILNRIVFGNKLRMCPIIVMDLSPYNEWGSCEGSLNEECEPCVDQILISSDFPSRAMFTAALAHEMVHQYQWEVDGPERIELDLPPLISHGPSFYAWRPVLQQFDIMLKVKM